MKNIIVSLEVAATTAQDFYVPAPCRGSVRQMSCVYDAETDADETVTLARGGSDVNVVTPPGAATAAGTLMAGTPDSDYKNLVFDPDSDTTANKVFKISVPDTLDTAGTLVVHIEYDDSAYVEQDPSEA